MSRLFSTQAAAIAIGNVALAIGCAVAMIFAWWRLGWKAVPVVSSALYAGVYGSRVWGAIAYGHARPLGDVWRRALSADYYSYYRHASFLGGITVGLSAACLVALILRMSPLRALGAICPGIAAGQAIGRIQCVVNGCCFGTPTTLPWGMRFPANTLAGFFSGPLPLHPTQIYEALLDGVLFLILVRRVTRGETESALSWYLLGYGAIRFGVEFFRADSGPNVYGLPSAQWMALLLVAVGLGLYVLSRTRVGSVGLPTGAEARLDAWRGDEHAAVDGLDRSDGPF